MARPWIRLLLKVVFSACVPQDAWAQNAQPAVTWIEVADLDYRDPNVHQCTGSFATWDSYINCLIGHPFESSLHLTPSATKAASRRNLLVAHPAIRTQQTRSNLSHVPGSGPEIFPHVPADHFPYPWPSRNKIPGLDDPDKIGHPTGIHIPPRISREYITNVNALNGRANFADTEAGSIGAADLRGLLENATCHSNASVVSAVSQSVTILPGQLISISGPVPLAIAECLSIVDVQGVKTPEAAMKAMRSLLTSHTPTLGKSVDDHFDDYILPSLRGGPYTAIASICAEGDRFRLLLLATPEQVRLGLDPELFLTPAGSQYINNPVFGPTLPATANRLRTMKVTSNCTSDQDFALFALAALRSLQVSTP